MSAPFEDALFLSNNIIIILTPVACNKLDVYKEIIKYSDLIRDNHHLVTIDKKENTDQISYEEFAKYQDETNNKIFFIDNIRFFMYYSIEMTNKSNSMIFLIDILDIEETAFSYITENNKFIYFYPRAMSIDIKLDYDIRKTYITNNQLTQYKKEYLKFISDPLKRDKNITEGLNSPSNYLNVYYDKIISSLENTSLENALSRAPKFKTIFLEILTRNKSRHLVHLPDNNYGIEAFEVIFNKLNTGISLTVIKGNLGLTEKMKKLSQFNNNNSPGVILTNYWFLGTNVPKNISYYHITNGGCNEDLTSVFDYVKVINKYSAKSNKFSIINHIATTVKGELTLDELKELEYKKKFERYSNNYNIMKKKSGKLFLEGSKWMVEK